ncbi:MAG: hypothetical protein AAGH88_13865 [Planctomycetota bacterium]
MQDELPDEIFVGPDDWNADPVEPCMTHYVRGDVAYQRLAASRAEGERLRLILAGWVSSLIGYAESAQYLQPQSDLDGWKAGMASYCEKAQRDVDRALNPTESEDNDD